ncbi:MAG: hypothetical protein M1833_006584 [Piccolia ochrophora]|nr:MAG: hypothetical protein M1833_006584 [Piccolia ochrophora]
MSASTQYSPQDKQQDRPRPPVQKLRSSCDGCHVAKVKCIPTGPQQNCSRCQSHNEPCSYSPSLRIGKPRGTKHSNTSSTSARARRPSVNAGAEVESSQSSSGRSRRVSRASTSGTSQALSDDFGLDDGRMEGLDMNHGWEEGPGPTDRQDFEDHASSDAYGHRQMANFMPTPSKASSGLTTTNSSFDNLRPLWNNQNYFQSNNLTEPYDNDGSMFWNGGTIEPFSCKQGLALSSLQEQDSACGPLYEQATTGEKGSLLGGGDSTELMRGEGVVRLGDEEGQQGDACNCLVPLLQAMQIPPHVTRAARGKEDGAALAAFDVLLATNQQAINVCVAMLGCASCFGSSTSFLLITAVLNQTLALYHSACKVYLARPAASDGEAAPRIVPGPLRLTLGAYRIEEEDEGLLKKELVLIELRKVESLLSRFRDLIGKVEDRAESGTYEALLAYLTRHLHQTVAVIQPRR